MAAKPSKTRIPHPSGEQYRLLFENNPHPMWVYDLKTLAFLAVNDAATSKYGYSKEEFLRMTISDIRPRDEVPRLLAVVSKSRPPLQHSGEWHHQLKDGSVIDVEITSHSIEFDGRSAALVVATDTTERKRVEETLRESEERLRTIIETEPECVKIVDRDGQLLEMNAAGLAMLEAPTLQDARQHTLLNFILPEHRDAFLALHERVMHGESGILEFEVMGLRGKRRWLETHAAPMRNATGEVDKLLGVTRDVTGRKRADDALRKSEARLKEAHRIGKMGSWSHEFTGRMSWSDEMFGIYGVSPETFVPTPETFIDLIHPEDRPEMQAWIEACAAGKKPGELEFRIKPADSTIRFISSRGELVCDAENRPIYMAGTAQDITERKRAEEALHKSEEKYRALVETTDTGYVIIDDQGKVLDANQEYVRLTGRKSLVDILNHPVLEWTAESDKKRNTEAVEHCMVQGFIRNLEIEYVHEDGTRVPIQIEATVVKTGSGMNILTLCRDITERRRAEEMLRENNDRMRAIVDRAPFGAHSYELYADGCLIFSGGNRSADRILGIDHSLLVGKTIEEAFPPLATTPIPDIYRKIAGTGESYQADQIDYEDDRIRGAFEIHAFQTESNRMTVFFRDITERKRAEEALRRSQEQMELLIENSEDIILLQDVDSKYLHYSGASRYGTKAEEVVGKYPVDFHDPQLAARIADRVRRVCLSDKSITEDEEVTWLGKRYWFNSQVSPAKDTKGKIVGAITVSRNITERKRLEEQLLQAQKLEAVGRLAGGVAHDYNNMIGVILGYAKLIEDRLNPLDPLRRNVQAIASAAERSANLTRQLLAFARKQVIAPVPLNLNDSLSSLERMLMRLIGEDITLTLHPGDKLWNTRIDPTQVDQILANLATNARDAISDVGTITIETANTTIDQSMLQQHPEFTPGDYVMLAFSDTGKGMDKETRGRIFEPFFTTKAEGQGTGLGLATVFGIVKQNSGFIHVYSEPGEGSTFKIYLPRFHGEIETPVERQEDVPLKGTETVLVVEDEEQLLELSCAALEMYGYSVLSAKSPGEAIILCERSEKNIDLLVTDVVMPGMNGKELKERLDPMRPGMKTIFMSGYTADLVANRGILNDGVFFLQKPFTPLILAKKVREVLNG